ncbi:hypothetical protein KSF_064840 [Reticulibacter mediterranei]|uniref:Methyltransferase type 12 domain-containing protein n=2 Tax=Reticulibacter mediterranei TaxID=2778369 RepID=A0A8J3IUG2_9CHLR|nr:hypothetical protein KSF_064840 [Reticulibacter mediterranei]
MNMKQRSYKQAKQRARTYYTEKHAASYNRTWQTFSEKTLAATCSLIDLERLHAVRDEQARVPRILDVACGTGLLLQRLAHLIPQAELYGVDGSQAMLEQARLLPEIGPCLHLLQTSLTKEQMADWPYQPSSFDLITCTNAFHYLDDPLAVLQVLVTLLAPRGQIVIEDYARRTFPFPWRIVEWFIQRVDPQHVRAYTLREALQCVQYGLTTRLHITAAKNFSIDLFWQGWIIAGTYWSLDDTQDI